MNILLLYTAIPHTTGQYLERALREVSSVRTCGPTISEGALRAWDLAAIADRVRPHDFPCPAVSAREVRHGLPDFSPDWILFVESGVWFEMPLLDEMAVPKACYLIDTHLRPRIISRLPAASTSFFWLRRPMSRSSGNDFPGLSTGFHWRPTKRSTAHGRFRRHLISGSVPPSRRFRTEGPAVSPASEFTSPSGGRGRFWRRCRSFCQGPGSFSIQRSRMT